MKTSPENTRNLLGGMQIWTGLFPLLGIMTFIAGWFTVTVEVFLRRDFGERYFNRMNFQAGLIVLGFFSFLSGIGSLFSGGDRPMPKVYIDPATGEYVRVEPTTSFLSSLLPNFSAMTWVLLLYVIFSGYHFFRVWWRESTDRPLHSYDAGLSWLEPLGKLGIGVANMVVGLIYGVYALTLPANERPWFPSLLPVLRDVRAFTHRFMEPFLLFILFIIASSAGLVSMASWLLFSNLALIFYNTMRLEAERYGILDIRDQQIEAMDLKAAMSDDTDSLRISYGMKNTLWHMSNKAEKAPETMEIIRRDSPSIAQAMEALNPKLKAMTSRQETAAPPVVSTPDPAPSSTVAEDSLPPDRAEAPPPLPEETKQGESLSVADALAALKPKKKKPPTQ